MCLIVLAWQVHPDYPLVVAANRDEYYSRPTAPAGFWAKFPEVFAGRDLVSGGTWLGVSRRRRFAALTNYREGGPQLADPPSRGALVAGFLRSDHDPATYLESLIKCGARYNGFNLLFSDCGRLAYYTNRRAAPAWLAPGIYGLSNHLLDTPWPKLAEAKASFTRALAKLPDSSPFFELLADQEIVADSYLPKSGIPLEWERILSAIFVTSPSYGTRASTLLTIDRGGRVTFVERCFGPAAELLGEVRESFMSTVISAQ